MQAAVFWNVGEAGWWRGSAPSSIGPDRLRADSRECAMGRE